MKWKIYKMTKEAWESGYNWDEALELNYVEEVEEYKTLEEAEKAYKKYNQDRYGIAQEDN